MSASGASLINDEWGDDDPMFSKRVTLFLVFFAAVLFCNPCPPAAVAQGAASVAHGPKSAAVRSSWLAQAHSQQLRRGPATPADLTLKALQSKATKPRRFGNGPLSLSNAIFLSALDYNSAGQSTHSVAYGDLNGDGKADLVLADQCSSNSNCSNGSVSVLLGNGDGTFQTAVSYNAGGQGTLSVVLGDVNGDGKLDVIASNDCSSNSNCTDGSVSVLLGNGDGTLQSAVSYDAGGEDSQYAVLGDVNGDGKADVLVVNYCASNNNCSNGSVSVLLGNGDGTFQTAVSYNSGGQGAMSVALGDVNGDGKADTVVANNCASNSNCSNGSVSVLLGNGDGTFQTAVSYSSGGQAAISVVLGDVNGDGKSDVVVANNCVSNSNCTNGWVGVLLGNGDGTFQQALGYNSGGNYAASVAVADINGDGKADLLVANQSDSDGDWMDGSVASVLLGNGDGTFQSAVSYASGDFDGSSLAVVDVDGDHKPDVVIANQCIDNYNCVNGSVSVLLGNGDGTLRGGVNYSPGAWDAYGVAIADVNADGKLDLLVASQCNDGNSCTNGAASVLLGNGDGTFQAGVSYSSGGLDAFSILTADVNGDGKDDLLVGNICGDNNCSSGSVSVLLGNGDGTFQSAVAYGSSGLYPYSLALADVNGDGKQDLIVANQCADNNCSIGSVGVLLGNGDGTFQTAVTYNPGALYSFSVAVADVNGDGKPDLVVASECLDNNCSNGEVGVLLGNGDGTFQTAVDYNSGGLYAFAIAVADLNGDGKPDLIVTNQCTDNNCTTGLIGVLLGNGDGTFQPATTTVTPVLGGIQSLVLGDFNGDHKLDLASGVGNILVLGNGDGTFQSPIPLGASGPGIAAGDFNGDGRPDLAVGGVSVLLNISNGFVFPSTTTVASSTNPSDVGESVTFTTTVTAQVSGIPTGTVTFSDGATVLGQGTLTSGTASFSTASLPTGSHSITASYSGDSRFTGSVSTALSQIVQKADTTTALSPAPSTANVNQSVTLTATVTPGTSGVPTGTVSFMDGTTQIGSSSLNGSGVATFSTSTFTAGTHAITAVYGGDGNFNGSTSSGANVVVTNSGFSLSSSAMAPASVAPGGSARSTITITSAGGFNSSTVNLSCSVSPRVSAAVTCSLGAISVTGGTGSSTLTVGTTGPVAALQKESGFSTLALALFMPGLFVCGAGMGKSSRRKLLTAGFIFLVLTGCMLQTACVGTSSSGNSTTTPGTPAGTYTVTVTGSAGGMQQTTSVSLAVQ
jgi:Bacterial Ig-like domain (group 3)/FG-GAP-like repeat/FG-GAP repeat